MFRQYSPQRFRYQTIRIGDRERQVCVGTVPVGTIFRCAPEHSRRERSLIVEAWQLSLPARRPLHPVLPGASGMTVLNTCASLGIVPTVRHADDRRLVARGAARDVHAQTAKAAPGESERA